MKKLVTLLLVLLSLCSYSQTITINTTSEDISQCLDLKVVARLFADAENIEQFEIMLNNPDSVFSNLDLNGDGNIDYLRVVESGSGNIRLIVIQAVLARDIYQDIASIFTIKDEENEISTQIIGDEYIYGKNYIIEPIYIFRPHIYNWLWSYRWRRWCSPYSWDYMPRWWHDHMHHQHHWYIDRCHAFHKYHRGSYRHTRHTYPGYHEVHKDVHRHDFADRHPEHSFEHQYTNLRNTRDIDNRHEHHVTSRRRNNQTYQRATYRSYDRQPTHDNTRIPAYDNHVRNNYQRSSTPHSRSSYTRTSGGDKNHVTRSSSTPRNNGNRR